RRARQCGVRVLFQSQGADELFWGYSWTRKAMAASELKCLLWERGPLALFEYLRASMWTPTTDGNWKLMLPASLALIRAWQDFCRDSRDALGQLTFYDLNPDFRAADEVVRGLYTDRFRSGIDPRGPFALFTVLPGPVLERPKRTFSPPLRAWHRRLFASYGRLLADGHLVGLGVLRPQAARDLARGYFPQGAGSTLSFKALVLELWCRVHR